MGRKREAKKSLNRLVEIKFGMGYCLKVFMKGNSWTQAGLLVKLLG